MTDKELRKLNRAQLLELLVAQSRELDRLREELELELPVMAQWSYPGLRTAPGRYTGTLLGRDLVIAAHNYLHHFGRLNQLSIGDEVVFTDVRGQRFHYTVADLEILQPTAIEEMTAGEYDLTLFTCTYGGRTRFTVRCMLAG